MFIVGHKHKKQILSRHCIWYKVSFQLNYFFVLVDIEI